MVPDPAGNGLDSLIENDEFFERDFLPQEMYQVVTPFLKMADYDIMAVVPALAIPDELLEMAVIVLVDKEVYSGLLPQGRGKRRHRLSSYAC